MLPYEIPLRLREFLDTVEYWIANNTYPGDELSTRFHHGLVLIHPFTNGNGRHSRLSADLMCRRLALAPFTWGRNNLDTLGKTRSTYLDALHAADAHDFAPLLEFVRS